MSTANIIYKPRIGLGPSALTTMLALPFSPRQNRLIAALPAEVCDTVRPNLVPVTLPFGEVLYECGERPEYVYFPVSAVVSLLYTTAEGATTEMGMTGNDGVVGIARFLGGDTTTHQAIVQTAGRAFKMSAQLLLAEFARNGPVQRVLLRYIQAFLTQVSQTGVCNRLHPVDKRLCRWLLLSHDRAQSNRLSMTQEFISNLLGSRRESVTVAAARLQDIGLIHYSRGNITILDRAGLESAACECYQTVKDECDRLFGSRYAAAVSV
jgi:CRP-like cAMP-binding protein